MKHKLLKHSKVRKLPRRDVGAFFCLYVPTIANCPNTSIHRHIMPPNKHYIKLNYPEMPEGIPHSIIVHRRGDIVGSFLGAFITITHSHANACLTDD